MDKSLFRSSMEQTIEIIKEERILKIYYLINNKITLLLIFKTQYNKLSSRDIF